MPELHEIDFDAIIKKWIAAGRKTGTFKGVVGDSDAATSKVGRRHLKKTTPTFLFKKPEPPSAP